MPPAIHAFAATRLAGGGLENTNVKDEAEREQGNGDRGKT
jgi:hypothetical protein